MKKLLILLMLIPILGIGQVIRTNSFPRAQLDNEVRIFYQNKIYLSDIIKSENSAADNGMQLRSMLILGRFDYLVVSDSFAIDIAVFEDLTVFFYPEGHLHVTDRLLYDNCYIDAGPYKLHESSDSLVVINCRYTYPYAEWLDGDAAKVNRLFPNYYHAGGSPQDTTFTPYIYSNISDPDSAAMVVHRKTPFVNQKIPSIDLIIETSTPLKGLATTIRVFVKGSDTTTHVANLSFGLSDTQLDGKIWFSTYWSVTQRWHTSTFEKGFWWIDGGILMKPGEPDVYRENLMFVGLDGKPYFCKNVNDTIIPFEIILEDKLTPFRAIPY